MSKRKKLLHKKLVVAAGIALLVIAMGGVGFLVWWLQHNAGGETAATPYNETVEKPGPAAVGEAQKLALGGKTDEAHAKLQEAIGKSTDNQEKQQLFVQQGVTYSNSGDYQKALDAYLEAEKVTSNFTTSHLIGETYEALGNTAKAIEYFKKGISQLDPNAISYDMDKRVYEDKIRELGGQP
jgi:tetratricopeptide (TPR) repeat protein